mgnify:CR=1 FL=1
MRALPGGELRAFARLENVLDQAYIGSVIVNDGNGRFFEPAPGRTWLASASFWPAAAFVAGSEKTRTAFSAAARRVTSSARSSGSTTSSAEACACPS